MASQLRDPEVLLETMFLIRHELITARTMAAQCHDIWMRMAEHRPARRRRGRGYARDLADQFDRVRSLADGESQFLFGVIELYQTKVNTKMTVAMERLAVIAAVTLPITAIASVYRHERDRQRRDAASSSSSVVLVVDGDDQPDAAALGATPGLVVMDDRLHPGHRARRDRPARARRRCSTPSGWARCPRSSTASPGRSDAATPGTATGS